MNFRTKLTEILLDCGKLAFGIALASDFFAGSGGRISFILALGVAVILFSFGLLLVLTQKKGGENG